MAESKVQIVHGVSLAIGNKISILEGIRDAWQTKLDYLADANDEAYFSDRYITIEDNISHLEEAIDQLEDAQLELTMIL